MAEQKIAKIVVDRNLCIGAATCVVTAGTVFELDGENKAVILQQGGTKNSGPAKRAVLKDAAVADATILAAAQSCPTRAIFLYDAAEKQIFP
ncbi:MAG: ferredoxin [Patescibacteria group bacterium]|nr:ferredoxin [Patescibacteria group bacterium]